MDQATLTAVVVVVRGTQARLLRQAAAVRRGGDCGVSTLEMVIIALGLMAVAGLLVAAITTAVTSRTNQLQ
jgi:HD-like signal output (HDOD) protein